MGLEKLEILKRKFVDKDARACAESKDIRNLGRRRRRRRTHRERRGSDPKYCRGDLANWMDLFKVLWYQCENAN